MTRPKYLFDASSIFMALKMARLVPLGGQAIQWLTVYEVLNALWKEAYLLHKLDVEEASSLIGVFRDLVGEMLILDTRGLEQNIFRIAFSKGVTVYDASYIALAERYNLTLVTEDKKLSHTARSIVKVSSLKDIISNS